MRKKKKKQKGLSKISTFFLSKRIRPLVYSQSLNDWLKAWAMVKNKIPPHISTFDQLDQLLGLRDHLFADFVHNLDMELHNERLSNPEMITKRIELAQWVYTRFPEENEWTRCNFRGFEAEAVWDLGEKDKADQLFQKLTENYPNFPWGYIWWADQYWMSDWSYENQPDYEKAESLYRKASGIPNHDEQDTIQKRIDDMLDKKAHPQKREEIWKNRQRVKQKQQQKEIFKVGNSVKVKEGMPCPDMEDLIIGGWQGRVTEVYEYEGDSMLSIQWDSLTLQNIPGHYIIESEQEGWDWCNFNLLFEDVEPASPRDTESDVDRVYSELSFKYEYVHLGEEGLRIQKILGGVDSQSEWAAFRAWESYLKTTLKFPFDAEVSEAQDHGHLRQGNKVQVTKMLEVLEMYGIIVELRHQKRKYQHPLCDLEVLHKKSSNYQPLEDYCIWFANR